MASFSSGCCVPSHLGLFHGWTRLLKARGPRLPGIELIWQRCGRGEILRSSERRKNSNDPTLDRLIDTANAQSLTLQIAGLRVDEARAILSIAELVSRCPEFDRILELIRLL